MLVLSRKKEQSITITTPAGQVRVMIVDIRGENVRLGITAPDSIEIERDDCKDRTRKHHNSLQPPQELKT